MGYSILSSWFLPGRSPASPATVVVHKDESGPLKASQLCDQPPSPDLFSHETDKPLV